MTENSLEKQRDINFEMLEEFNLRLPTYEDRILMMLKQSMKNGISGLRLSTVTHRFGAVIHELKDKGYNIKIKKVPNTSNIEYQYYLLNEKPVNVKKKKKNIDILSNIIREDYHGTITSEDLKVILKKNNLHLVHNPNTIKRFEED